MGTTLNPTNWREWVATNDASMYALAAIQNLALIADQIPDLPGSWPRITTRTTRR